MTQTPARPGLPPEIDPRRADVPPLRRRPTRARRILTWVAALTSAAVVLTSAGLYLGFRHYNGKLTRTDIRLPQDSTAPAAAADGPAQNFLIVGSDTREAPGTEKFGAAKDSSRFVSGARSDTIMLLHLPSGNTRATIVSFPRDAWVPIPAYTPPNGTRRSAHNQRINSAFALGGASLLVQVVQGLSGLRVDHYVQVDFAGFQRIVDAVGGVTVCVRTTRNDKDSGDYLTAGTHQINGKQALAMARDRKTFAALQDLARIKDQQYLISVLLRKVLSAGTLANPFKVTALVNAVVSSTTVDRDLSVSDMRTLAVRMRRLDPKNVNLVTAPIKGDARINGNAVKLLDDAKMKVLFDSLRGTEPPNVTAPRVTVAPGNISVSVSNGAGQAGLATRGTADLRRVGFLARVAGSNGSGATDTVIQYGAGAAAKAQTVVAALPGSTARSDPAAPAGSVAVILGSRYAGARAVSVGGTGTAAPNGTTAAQSASSCAQ